ncbi:hypothetical protein [Zavarzinella formosa]|uniref:hypothetical protein n=1 Tax=Zavarzinella formosa TaxID=360055 RepID=UPI000318496B|nr:hypothetical protein [Zavarzinella formosa]
MAAISVQSLAAFTALNHTYGSVTSLDTVANDGNTILLFKNGNASARTLTLTGVATTVPGFGTISSADTTETITIPGSGTNGGECVVGLMPPNRFNNNSGQVVLTIDVTTGLTVAAVSLARPA